MPPVVSIIIPTWNLPQFLNPCVDSIISTGCLSGLCELIIVNNGTQPIKERYGHIPNIKVLEPGKNLGWEGGLALGAKESTAPFLCFQNDDTFIPFANQSFYHRLLMRFNDENVAAVGPATTNAAGWHSVFMSGPLRQTTEVSFLIFFTVMIRRSHYDAVGGIDVTAPGGDDFDLSIRLRAAGKKLLIAPDAFIIHHGFKSGERARGTSDKVGGWNSKEMTDNTNKWLIQKHGFKSFFLTRVGLPPEASKPSVDTEGEMIASLVKEDERVIELGCGGRKTVPWAVGVDRVPAGEHIPHVNMKSVADIVADVAKPLPIEENSADVLISRHILEHCLDQVQTIRNWSKFLRVGGRMIIAVPNEQVLQGIPLNSEHAHAFEPNSLRNFMAMCGLKETRVMDPKNGISFIGVYEKLHQRETVDA